MTEDVRDYDVVVLGATGFTGRLVVEYLHNNYGEGGELSWAIAGRNQDKLVALRREILGDDADRLPIIVADSDDEESLGELVAKTRVVATTVRTLREIWNEAGGGLRPRRDPLLRLDRRSSVDASDDRRGAHDGSINGSPDRSYVRLRQYSFRPRRVFHAARHVRPCWRLFERGRMSDCSAPVVA
ncbi:MAG: saccharopine dehydrogenase NADP-binding domain-containing protein [Gammaproteobacteria bacterium]|nr:saccharopine dehydrogenase NADP-binding domain-containing protein [Gammaproteobacteria bacterium]